MAASNTSDAATAVTSGFGDVTALMTGTIIPAAFGLTILVLGVTVGIKWLRKVTNKG